MKILVIDDDEGILDAIQVLLESSGYEVETSFDGQGVLEKLSYDIPGVILLDTLLSGKDGRDICRQIKAHQNTRRIPIIMISAHPSAETSSKASGADDFLAKPFNIEELEQAIAKYTSKLDKSTIKPPTLH